MRQKAAAPTGPVHNENGHDMAHPNFSVHIIDPDGLRAIERAAKRAKMSRSKFVFDAAVKAAQKTLEDNRRRKAA